MPTIRRLYLYLVSLVSLMALMVGLINASAGLVRLWLNAQPWQITGTELATSGLGRWVIIVLISAPAWALHWYLANRRARPLTIAGAAERSAAARKAFFYTGRFGALVAWIGQAGLLIYDLLLRALGAGGIAGAWPAGPLALAAGVLLAFLFWLYLYLAARHDGDTGHEPGAGAGWRRAYDYLGAFLATALAAVGAAGFMQAVLGLLGEMFLSQARLPGASAWRAGVASGLAALLVAAPVAGWHWRRADWAAADDQSGSEVNSLGRKLLLYAVLLAGVAGTVLSAAYLVLTLALILLGQPVDDLAGLWNSSLAPALSYLPVAIILWVAFGRTLRADLAWAPESADAAALRHLYFYLMAAILLAGFWWGLQQALAVALFLGLGLEAPAALAAPAARNTSSLALALLVAAGPGWWWHWRRAQAWARDGGSTGYDERASTLRKLYLYGVVVAAAAVVIVTLGIVIYHAPAWLLGPRTGPDFAAALVQFGVAITLALIFWIGHGVVMRDDARLQPAEPVSALPEVSEPLPVGGRQDEAFASSADEPDTGWAPGADGVMTPLQLESGPDQADELGPAGVDEVTALEASAPITPPPVPPAERPPVIVRLRRGQYDRAELAADRAAFAAHAERDQAAPSASGGQPDGEPSGAADALPDMAPESAADEAGPAGTALAVAVVDGGSGALGANLLRALHLALPQVLLWPLGLNDAARQTMFAACDDLPAGTPVDALDRAVAIVGPSDILVPGGLGGEMPSELAAAIAGSSARKVLLPAIDPRLRWAGAPAWSAERWVAQAVAEVSRLLSPADGG